MMKKVKRYKWLLVIYIMVSAIFTKKTSVNAVNFLDYKDFGNYTYYELEDGTISIVRYNGTDELLIIPSELDDKKVSQVGGNSSIINFSDEDKIKHLVIEKGIKKIENSAFWNFINLQTVFLPEGIEEISDSSFSGCRNLETINIPSSVKIIGEFAFDSCESLKSIILPNSNVSLGIRPYYVNDEELIKIDTFLGCTSLIIYTNSDSPLMKTENINHIKIICINHPQIITDEAIPSTCTQDGKTEGSHCSVCDYKIPQETIKATGQHIWDEGIITLEPTVTTEGTKLFTCKTCKTNKTEKIAKLPLPQTGNTITNSDDSYKVTKSGTTDGTVQYSATKKSKTTITIPDTVTINGITYKVTAVSKNAFKNNKKLKKVIIGKNVTKIEANAFSGCKNLKAITVKSTKLKSVGKNAFKEIHKNAKIKVPASKLKKYKKLMGKKGQKSTVKIIK